MTVSANFEILSKSNTFLHFPLLEKKPRKGSEVDVKNLENMFYELRYEYEIWYNLDVHEYKKKIKILKKELLTKKYGCLLFFFMSHGNEHELKLEECKKSCCNKKMINREEFKNSFLISDETEETAIILFMNNCRKQNPLPGNLTFYEFFNLYFLNNPLEQNNTNDSEDSTDGSYEKVHKNRDVLMFYSTENRKYSKYIYFLIIE